MRYALLALALVVLSSGSTFAQSVPYYPYPYAAPHEEWRGEYHHHGRWAEEQLRRDEESHRWWCHRHPWKCYR